MISFIIIGRNEGSKLTKCFNSVLTAIASNKLEQYEIIYVDSNSTDDSIERAKLFKEIKIFKLTDIYNPAIARNIGVKESLGDILFLIDGDMEIIQEFLPLVYSTVNGLKYPFVSGQLKNFNYDKEGNFIYNSWQYKEILSGAKYYSTTGGIFLIERKLWNLVCGMDNSFKKGEDLDLALRIAKYNYRILRRKEIIANHYTISYTSKSRRWQTLFSGDISYSNSFLFRKHIFNPYLYNLMIKTNYTLLALLFSLLLAGLTGHWIFLIFYFIVLVIKIYKNRKFTSLLGIDLIPFYVIRDLVIILYFFIPIPNVDKNKIEYFLVKQ